MIELCTWTTPNGRKVSVLLEEAGFPHNVHPVNIRNGDQFKPEFVKICPNSKIPAIVDSDTHVSVFESGAILIHLAEKPGSFFPRRIPPPMGEGSRRRRIAYAVARSRKARTALLKASGWSIFAAWPAFARMTFSAPGILPAM